MVKKAILGFGFFNAFGCIVFLCMNAGILLLSPDTTLVGALRSDITNVLIGQEVVTNSTDTIFIQDSPRVFDEYLDYTESTIYKHPLVADMISRLDEKFGDDNWKIGGYTQVHNIVTYVVAGGNLDQGAWYFHYRWEGAWIYYFEECVC